MSIKFYILEIFFPVNFTTEARAEAWSHCCHLSKIAGNKDVDTANLVARDSVETPIRSTRET